MDWWYVRIPLSDTTGTVGPVCHIVWYSVISNPNDFMKLQKQYIKLSEIGEKQYLHL